MPADLSLLHPEEAATMAKAVDKRRREFTAGRVLARRAMAELGVPEATLLNGEDRAPIWPSEVTGSITHTHTWCAAALAHASDIRGVGLDVERNMPLKPDVLDAILSDDDRRWLAEYSEDEQCALGKLVFSAKESAYKAQYAITRQFLGFDAMWIELDDVAGEFLAHFRQASGEFAVGHTLAGRFARRHELVATVVEID